MARSNFALKSLILVAVGSFFAYVLFWFAKSIPLVVEISLSPEAYVPATGLRFINSYSLFSAYLMEYSGLAGLIVRVAGASYALGAALLFLRAKPNSFQAICDKVSKALLLEGFYFLSLVPAMYFLLNFSALPAVSNFLLSAAILAQILLISPSLVNLGFKVRKYKAGIGGSSLMRWAGLAAMNYVIALWVIYMLKWTEMTAVDPYLFSAFSVRILGLLNTAIVQSLAVVFAVVGFLHVLRKSGADNTMRWWGLSLIFLSSHIIIYVIYVISVGIPRFIPFGELWVIPLLGLGVYLLLKNPKVKPAP
jgi:hypothetical protein